MSIDVLLDAGYANITDREISKSVFQKLLMHRDSPLPYFQPVIQKGLHQLWKVEADNAEMELPSNAEKDQGYLVGTSFTATDYVTASLQYYNRGEYEKCIDASEKALDLDPAISAAYNNICVSNIQLKRWDRAIDACEKAIALNPDIKLFRNNLAWAQREEAKD